MKKCDGVEVQLHAFLTLGLDYVIGQLYDPAVLTLGKEPPGIHLIKGGVSP
jgi:hypothetical protein